MAECLLDSGPISALAMPDDQFHDRARAYSRTPNLRLHTTAAAAGEAYTFIRRRSTFAIAFRALQGIRSSSVITVHTMDDDLERGTWRVIEEFAGVPLSYVDASLVALGRQLRVRRIFAFDEDFALAGLELVPGDDS
jgi:predicted nucleic acid-binding protein